MPLPDVWGELRRTPFWRSSHSGHSAKFAYTEFSEVQSRIMHRLPLRAPRMASKRASARRAARRGPVVTKETGRAQPESSPSQPNALMPGTK